MEHSNYYQTEEYQNKLGRLVFDRDELEELTRKKIAEVNEETGYRVYFEVPEMVEIIASIVEDKFRVERDDLINQIHLLSKELDKAQLEAEFFENGN
jgi:hypothetical protein